MSKSQRCRAPSPTRPCVLIVDPEPDVRESLGEVVAVWGYAPAMAASAGEALQLARVRRPAVVMTELHLGDLDAERLLADLRRSSAADRPTFIALTSWCRSEDLQRARRVGFHEVLLKPPDLEKLRRLLLDVV